jgi:hypothetical protein
MKKIMQLIGAKVVSAGMRADGLDSVVELAFIPFTSEKMKLKRPSLMDMALGGGIDIQEIVKQAKGMESHLTIIYVSLEEYLETFKNKILTKCEIEITPNLFHDGKINRSD